MTAKTLYDKLFESHIVASDGDKHLLYIDRQLVHEVTSPQAFAGLQLANRKVWRTATHVAVADHNVPTTDRDKPIADKLSRLQVNTLEKNCEHFNIKYIPLNDIHQGIVHVIGPELGLTQPGMTIVCGDSHTSTHGAFGALAHGIGTSEVEHVLATNCLWQKKLKNLQIKIEGKLKKGVYPKDLILAIIGKLGTAGGTGYAMEFSGSTIRDMSMEGRMTVCNMAIEAGARAGLIGVDDTTINYLKDKEFTPKGELFAKAKAHWLQFKTDKDAKYDLTIEIDASKLKPQVTWGTSPEMVVAVDSKIPDPKEYDKDKAINIQNALNYMNLQPNTPIKDIKLDKVFIGSCTNSRIEDLIAAADFVKGKKVASSIKLAMVVPGSGVVKEQAEKLGLDKIFKAAGFEWREPGCSMCIAMNADKLNKGEHCASTSNRNFEGRQGQGGCTHLVSPVMAAAAAINGHFIDVSEE